MMISYGLMVTIICINFERRMTIIWLVTWIGYDTQSKLMSKITSCVFVGLFFNTGFLLTMTNANLSDVNSWLSVIFNGRYYDYSPRWYAMVGSTLVPTMLINAFTPAMFEVTTNMKVWFLKKFDNGCRVCESETTS